MNLEQVHTLGKTAMTGHLPTCDWMYIYRLYVRVCICLRLSGNKILCGTALAVSNWAF